MPKTFNWARDGRTLLADGVPALYLDRELPADKHAPLSPYEVDCVARQLFNALQRGVINVPASVYETNTLDDLPNPLAMTVLQAARALVNAIDSASPPELTEARRALKEDGADLVQSAARRRYARLAYHYLGYVE